MDRGKPEAFGNKVWVIAEGYIPATSHGPRPAMESHETACMVNLNDEPASVELWVYFEDREPLGPFLLRVEGRRTRHLRFNELTDPAPIPRATPYSSLIKSSVPIIVQHTRLDSRQSANALLSTIAFPAA